MAILIVWNYLHYLHLRLQMMTNIEKLPRIGRISLNFLVNISENNSFSIQYFYTLVVYLPNHLSRSPPASTVVIKEIENFNFYVCSKFSKYCGLYLTWQILYFCFFSLSFSTEMTCTLEGCLPKIIFILFGLGVGFFCLFIRLLIFLIYFFFNWWVTYNCSEFHIHFISGLLPCCLH